MHHGVAECALFRTTPCVLVHLFMPVAPATLGRFDWFLGMDVDGSAAFGKSFLVLSAKVIVGAAVLVSQT